MLRLRQLQKFADFAGSDSRCLSKDKRIQPKGVFFSTSRGIYMLPKDV